MRHKDNMARNLPAATSAHRIRSVMHGDYNQGSVRGVWSVHLDLHYNPTLLTYRRVH